MNEGRQFWKAMLYRCDGGEYGNAVTPPAMELLVQRVVEVVA